jgi:predicted dehydrogenase
VPHLRRSPHVELVAVCDTEVERARRHATTHQIARYYDDVDRLLAEVDFDLLVNLTPMQFHAPVSRKGLEAGRHVWSEKPIATDLRQARELLELARARGLGLWAAPNSPISPAFRCMAAILAGGEIGRAVAGHGIYGWRGPDWPGTAWYYQPGGGALFDLGVYNITTLTGLLGPARAVVALSGVAIPERTIAGETVRVEADDNTALLLDHDQAVYSSIQTGFVYGAQAEAWTIQVITTGGAMTLGGYDWDPRNVTVYDPGAPGGEVRCADQGDYTWYSGAAYVAECLARGQQPVLRPEHAVHVLEVMLAVERAAATGRLVPIESSFTWPLIEETR